MNINYIVIYLQPTYYHTEGLELILTHHSYQIG